MTKIKRMRPLLGTFVEISVLSDDKNASALITQAFNVIEQIQILLSFHDPRSELSQLNRYGPKGVDLHPISADVLRLALHMTGLSKGDFNCTIGGALVQKGLLPNHGGVNPLVCGDADDVILDGCHVSLKRPVRITLDGIAKGYAVDQAVNYLKQHNIETGWINAGGDLRVFGEVSLPVYQRQLDHTVRYLGDFSNTSIATSSNASNYDPCFPGMILDSHNIRSPRGVWSVKAGLSWLADALTKVACVNSAATSRAKIADLGGELLIGKT